MAKKKDVRPEVSFHDIVTGEIIVREMNDEEYASYQSDLAATLVKQEEQATLLQKKNDALEKLNKLGLTEEDLRAVLS